MSKQKSFTLIELLVVIAIIGLLAGVVLVSLRGARQRAKIAAAMQFSDSLRASLSDALVSWWSFNEGTGGAAGDTWGGNNGIISGASWTKGVAGDALSFDGVNDVVEAPDSDSLDLTSEGTIEAWVKSNLATNNTNRGIVFKGEAGGPGGIAYLFYWNINNWLRGIVCNGGSCNTIERELIFNTTKWYHVVFAWNGTILKLYVDGKLFESEPQTVNVHPTTHRLWIGRAALSNQLWNGIIDEVRIYSRGLTAFEIQKRYAEGLEKYKNFVLQES